MVVITLSPTGATEAESRRLNVLRGDSARVRTLQLAGIDRAKVLIIPDDEPAHAHRIVMVARALNPTLHLLPALAPEGLPRFDAVALYARVAGFALAMTCVTGLTFGLVPAWHATRAGLVGSLRDGGHGVTEGPNRQLTRSVLVVAQLGLAVVLARRWWWTYRKVVASQHRWDAVMEAPRR